MFRSIVLAALAAFSVSAAALDLNLFGSQGSAESLAATSSNSGSVSGASVLGLTFGTSSGSAEAGQQSGVFADSQGATTATQGYSTSNHTTAAGALGFSNSLAGGGSGAESLGGATVNWGTVGIGINP
jgi:hypothetical protein